MGPKTGTKNWDQKIGPENRVRKKAGKQGRNMGKLMAMSDVAAKENQVSDAQSEAIRVTDLHKSFGALEVLKGVSLTAHKGDVVAIIGGSGSGKSTFLRCINFLETPSSGQIVVNGEEIQMRADGTPVHRKQIERIRTRLGMVFQAFNLFPHKTALGNVMLAPMKVLKQSKAEAQKTAESLLERVGLADRMGNDS